MHARASDLRAHADLLESGAAAPGPTTAAPSEPPQPPGTGPTTPTGMGPPPAIIGP
jgi:hypothetical protein